MAFTDSAADMLGGLKSRLGFGRKDEEFYDDDYQYDDDNLDEPGDDYSRDSAVGGYRPIGASTSRTS